jgi:hypothetical protein
MCPFLPSVKDISHVSRSYKQSPFQPQKLSMQIPQPTLVGMHSKQPFSRAYEVNAVNIGDTLTPGRVSNGLRWHEIESPHRYPRRCSATWRVWKIMRSTLGRLLGYVLRGFKSVLGYLCPCKGTNLEIEIIFEQSPPLAVKPGVSSQAFVLVHIMVVLHTWPRGPWEKMV